MCAILPPINEPMRRILVLTVFWLGVCASRLCAQAPLPIRAGSEVRIETTAGRLFRGTLLEATRDSVRLSQAIRDSVITLPGSALSAYSVLQIDRWRGARRGFLIGGVIGLGLVLGFTAANASDDDVSAQIGLLAALPIGLLSGGLGAGIGAALAPTSWSDPVQLRVARHAGVSVGFAFGF